MNSYLDLDEAIDRWFLEDIGDGDHTTFSIIPPEVTGSALLIVKEKGILAGVNIAEQIFRRFDKDLELTLLIEDGNVIVPDDVVFFRSLRGVFQIVSQQGGKFQFLQESGKFGIVRL